MTFFLILKYFVKRCDVPLKFLKFGRECASLLFERTECYPLEFRARGIFKGQDSLLLAWNKEAQNMQNGSLNMASGSVNQMRRVEAKQTEWGAEIHLVTRYQTENLPIVERERNEHVYKE